MTQAPEHGDRDGTGADRVSRASATEPHGGLAPPLPGGEPIEALLRKAQFLTPTGTPSEEEFYPERWRHDIVFRSRKAGHPTEPGTGGRKWRRIGVPY